MIAFAIGYGSETCFFVRLPNDTATRCCRASRSDAITTVSSKTRLIEQVLHRLDC